MAACRSRACYWHMHCSWQTIANSHWVHKLLLMTVPTMSLLYLLSVAECCNQPVYKHGVIHKTHKYITYCIVDRGGLGHGHPQATCTINLVKSGHVIFDHHCGRPALNAGPTPNTLSVYESVCLLTYLRNRMAKNFTGSSVHVAVSMVWSSTGSIAICYVHLFLWMMSCFYIMCIPQWLHSITAKIIALVLTI